MSLCPSVYECDVLHKQREPTASSKGLLYSFAITPK